MKKYILFIFILLLSLSLNAEMKNKIKVEVFSNEESCWYCLKGTKEISELELENTELEITLYFCNKSRDLLNSLLMDYDLNINTVLDPLYLYPKHYEITTLPAIIIRDTKDSIILKEVWNSNPQKYIQLIKKIDNDFVANVNNIYYIEGLEFIKTLTLKDSNNNSIFNNRFDGFYNPNNNCYYGVIGNEAKISVFDSVGVLVDKINLEQDGVKCFMPLTVQLANDTNVIWSDMHINLNSTGGKRCFYSLNLNTKLIERKIQKIDVVDSGKLGNSFVQIPNTNKFVWYVWYNDNVYLNNNSKLLVMLDNNKVSYFGRVDSILSKVKVSNFMWNINLATDNKSNIYSLSPLSNKLFMYNQNGNYIKTINLEFEDGFLEKPTNLYEDILNSVEIINIYNNYKMLRKLSIIDNDIYVVHSVFVSNKAEFKFKDKIYWLTHFDQNGKIIGKTIKLPLNFQPIYIENNQLLIQYMDTSSKFSFYWYKIL